MPEFNPFTGYGPVPIIGVKCVHCEETIEPGDPAVSVFFGVIGRGKKSGNYMVVEQSQDEDDLKEQVLHMGCLPHYSLYATDTEPDEIIYDTCPDCGGPLTICKHCGGDAHDFYEQQERLKAGPNNGSPF